MHMDKSVAHETGISLEGRLFLLDGGLSMLESRLSLLESRPINVRETMKILESCICFEATGKSLRKFKRDDYNLDVIYQKVRERQLLRKLKEDA